MAITASGLYGPTLQKMLLDTSAQSLEGSVNVLMVTDASTPDFDAHDFRDDVDGAAYTEVSGTGYTTGGKAMTTPDVAIATGLLTYDGDNVEWTGSTIADAMAAIGYFNVGTAATDQLVFLSDFVTGASTSNGTFTIQWDAAGIFTIDYTP